MPAHDFVRGTFVYRDGELIEKHLAEPLPRGPRSTAVAAPYVQSDTILGGLQSMADGRVYDSKAALRRHYKQAGVREIGTDTEGAVKDAFARMPKRPSVRQELEAGFKKVRDGYKPPPLKTLADVPLD